MEFKFIADVDTAFVELQAGTIDILKYLTAAQAETLGDEDYNIVQGSMNLVHAMYLSNTSRFPRQRCVRHSAMR